MVQSIGDRQVILKLDPSDYSIKSQLLHIREYFFNDVNWLYDKQGICNLREYPRSCMIQDLDIVIFSMKYRSPVTGFCTEQDTFFISDNSITHLSY